MTPKNSQAQQTGDADKRAENAGNDRHNPEVPCMLRGGTSQAGLVDTQLPNADEFVF